MQRRADAWCGCCWRAATSAASRCAATASRRCALRPRSRPRPRAAGHQGLRRPGTRPGRR